MTMAQWRPDPTFYPRMAIEAPREKLAYLALLNPKLAGKRDAIAVVDVDPTSKTYSQVVGQADEPTGVGSARSISATLAPERSPP